MKTINLTKAKDSFSEVVKDSQDEVIVVTVHGKPAALIRGVDGFSLDELLMYADPKFWSWVAKRQRRAQDGSKTVSAADARSRLLGRKSKR